MTVDEHHRDLTLVGIQDCPQERGLLTLSLSSLLISLPVGDHLLVVNVRQQFSRNGIDQIISGEGTPCSDTDDPLVVMITEAGKEIGLLVITQIFLFAGEPLDLGRRAREGLDEESTHDGHGEVGEMIKGRCRPWVRL